MSLIVKHLHLSDFRSYRAFDLEPDDRLTVLVGPNAVGKTNLIEAMQLLTAAESFRKPQWTDVVRWGCLSADLKLTADGEARHLETELTISPSGRREYRVNGKLRKRISEVVGVLPCVVFTPDDLRVVKDSAERRRSALDALGTQLSPSYLRLKADYDRIIKQRNALLRSETEVEKQIGALDEQLVSTGSRLYQSRVRLFARLAAAMTTAHEGVAARSELIPAYVASWEREGRSYEGEAAENILWAQLEEKRPEERARKASLVGPHRDDITFLLEGKDARTFASQGQQRTIALAWKLAEVMVVREVSGQPPVLLLDDVMSELDPERRHALTRFVGTAAQTIVTTTNLDYFDPELLSRAKVVRLER